MSDISVSETRLKFETINLFYTKDTHLYRHTHASHKWLGRAKVTGGWIVKHTTSITRNRGKTHEDYESTSSITFIADPAHQWTLDDMQEIDEIV